MVAKKKYVKRKKTVKKSYRRHRRPRSGVVMMSSNGNTPVPPRLRAKLSTEITGVIPIGSFGLNTGVNFCCGMNFCYQPFTSGGHNWGNLTQNSSLTQNPTGFLFYCSNNGYLRYRVLASAIEVALMIGSIADAVTMVITPSTTVNLPGTIQGATGQPFSKKMDFIFAREENGRSTLKNYIATHTLVGCSKAALDNDLSLQFAALYNQDPSNPMFWTTNFATISNAVSVAAMNFRVKVTYYVEFWEPAGAAFLN